MSYYETFTLSELKAAYSFLIWKKMKRKFTESDKIELATIHSFIIRSSEYEET